MRIEHLRFLACPACTGDLLLLEPSDLLRPEPSDLLRPEPSDGPASAVETGTLACGQCQRRYPIRAGVPRFVPPSNYADGFGLEWTLHARTQYDSYTGRPISRTRFFQETGWPTRMDGEVILEVGSGSGRFTEQTISTGAMVVSMDYSRAVDVNYAANGRAENLLVVQGDVYQMPFREASFDRLFCFGVLQHTPDPEGAFEALPRYLRPGGHLAVDVYRRVEGPRALLVTKNWLRPLTRRLPPERLYPLCKRYVETLWPLVGALHALPYLGVRLTSMLLVPYYRGVYDLPEPLLKEWAILDAFDMLSPAYDSPQSLADVRRWFERAGLVACEVGRGYNGIEGRGRRPGPPAA